MCFLYEWCRVIRISPFANRLSFDAPPAVQRLRCLANYEALRFANPILTMGETLVARMRERSVNDSGKYISVHLRFEEVSLHYCDDKLSQIFPSKIKLLCQLVVQ